ncbi:MAG TPA: damage-control phosphatase ARMT1 family protein [Anaerolineae bacterium]|nr:damage-control phosphatase ARMT1 family protein [Anaerolineae bacterium]
MTVDRSSYPPPLVTSERGSFARKTIVERKPQILREVSESYPYPPEIHSELEAYAHEIAALPIAPLHEEAPDVGEWNAAWAAFGGRTWLEVPWYFAESFFYRRLMEVVRYYQPGPWHNVDPFAPQKAIELERALPRFLSVLERQHSDLQRSFAVMLRDALWGNRADLSNRTISARAEEGLADTGSERLLIDDTPRIWQHLLRRAPARVDIVPDNSGLELLLDLRLADSLVRSGLAQVRFHLKHMPFFVSDAMIRDLEQTLIGLEGSSEASAALASRVRAAIEEGQIVLHDDPFWSTCLSYHQLPPRIERELANADLVLFKGDVNYRRVLDDRHWPHTAHLAEIARHLPAPFAVLRTLKGELIVDLQPGQAEALAAADPTWMIDGQRGVIQFVDPTARAGSRARDG